MPCLCTTDAKNCALPIAKYCALLVAAYNQASNRIRKCIRRTAGMIKFDT